MKPNDPTSSPRLIVAVFVAIFALGLGWVPACANSDRGAVTVLVEGPHAVAVGSTIILTASTVHGTDHDHTWSSDDETIATVAADGTVTGVAKGETVIIARGADTDVTGQHVLVVIANGVAGTGGDPDTGDSGDSGGSGDSESADDADSGDTGDPGAGVPFYDQWMMSAHADATAEAFNHWNDDGEIPTTCARCHSREGFRDYVGEDLSEVGVVNQAAPIGSVVDCQTCHNDAAAALDWVEFPSGSVIENLGAEARCMTCHQGRGSTDSVDATITAAGVGDDTVSEALSFENIHYFPAAATLYAGQARGGYQYADDVYDRRFRHVPEFNTCVECHDPHTARPRFDACTACHENAGDLDGARDIRMIASRNVDYDGDGDTTVGVYYEIRGLEEKLYRAIQRYGSGVIGQTICYSASEYPYWFKSTAGATAECTEDEAEFDNRYLSWTPRLVRAAYNYQMARKDPGAFAHNSRYIIKLLFDAITDINGTIASPVDMSQAKRDAPGHFNGASEAARHWDEDESVSASCSKCHSGEQGFRFFAEYGVGLEVPETANGLECYTCHENFGDTYDVVEVAATTYPGGTVLEHQGYDNICATCHSGRQSGATIDAAIDAGQLGFRNVHYLAAAGVRNGNLSGVGYQYAGMAYAGSLQHANRTQCVGCHDAELSNHTFRISDVWDSVCSTCHSDQTGPAQIRIAHLEDYDGDANTSETLPAELQGLADTLLIEMVAAATSPLCYAERYPYFIGAGGDAGGHCAPDVAAGGFSAWTPELMSAAHNFQLHHTEPGAYAHNFEYTAQLLIDSIADLGGDVTGLTRP